MSTATKKPTKKKTGLVAIEIAECRVEEAKRALQAAKDRERQHAGKVGGLRASRLHWQVENPSEFGENGTTAPGSQAEKLTKAVRQEIASYEESEYAQA